MYNMNLFTNKIKIIIKKLMKYYKQVVVYNNILKEKK